MSEILNIPAGVIQPRELLTWLRGRRDDAREIKNDYLMQEDQEAAEWRGYEAAYDEVIQHIQYGDAS